MKYSTQQEKARIKKIEKGLLNRVNAVSDLIKNEFSDYVRSYGITGAMARGEGTIFFKNNVIIGSDIDLAIVTNFRSLRAQKKLEKKIKDIFRDFPVEAGSLFFSPSIFKMPDLMFYEYVKSGKVLYGEKIDYNCTIPAWEAAKILTSRCGTLFDNIKFNGKISFSDKFAYAWSKSVLSAAEALLILENDFSHSFKGRISLINKHKSTRQYKKIFKQAFYCRYSGIVPSSPALIMHTSSLLSFVFEETAKKIMGKSGKNMIKIRAPFPSIASTRLFYLTNTLKKKRSNLTIAEPLVKEFVEMADAFSLLKNNRIPSEIQRQRIVHLWKYAERFWLPY